MQTTGMNNETNNPSGWVAYLKIGWGIFLIVLLVILMLT
jgi:hypothetical protein